MFQELNTGDKVTVKKELSQKAGGFPDVVQGRTGIVEGKRGRAYIINIMDGNCNKRYIIRPIHLKKLK